MPDNLKLLIRAGNPLISVETTDEQRALDRIRSVVREMSRPLYEWSMTTGLQRIGEDGVASSVTPGGKAIEALSSIRKNPDTGVYAFKDLGPHCKDAEVHRTMRDLLTLLPSVDGIVFLIDALPVPDEIARFAVRYEIGWPSAEELESVVRKTFKSIRRESLHEVTSNITKRDMEHLVQSLRGLSCTEAERVVSFAIYDDYALNTEDLPRIIEAKRTLLGSTGCLEAIVADVHPEDVGGLENLKSWLNTRRHGFSRKAREYGLESPRGVLMLGVPGSGKSLCAKVVAADWHMPMLRLDPGNLFQKFIGESEGQLRRALKQAEAMAPVVLWIDEIEKAFASASTASADGGLSKRMFGTLLSWMQDHRHPIFIVATANDISALPPELMRKGRFDEVFFVDLPEKSTRSRILAIHLRRRKRNPDDFNLDDLAEAADGFTGSELEQAVVSAMFAAFSANEEVDNGHVLDAIRSTQPLSRLMSEHIADLREWARHRCIRAD